MTNEEAKFILSAYRPNGADAEDKVFREALCQSMWDPELRRWLEKQQAFDRSIAEKLERLQPPASLALEILTLARVSARSKSRTRRWTWLLASLAAVLACAVLVLQHGTARSAVDDLSSIALRDAAEASLDHFGQSPELNDLQVRLASASMPWSHGLAVDIDELAKRHCRTLDAGNHRILEICFSRAGTWYHLYVAPRAEFGGAPAEPRVVGGPAQLACATWAYADYQYALVAPAAPEALRRMI